MSTTQGATATLAGLQRQATVAIHRTMVRIRLFETRVQSLFREGKLPGFVHTYLGEEAVAAAVCATLAAGDYLTSTHRGHGHAIAKGVGLDRLMAELYGKANGVCKGHGGSMHVADFSLGMLGANGIVAGGCGLAAGAGLSALHRRSGQVVACFFGDGAVNKGSFHEALNFSALRKLPIVFVCENNQYAQFTGYRRTTSINDLATRAAGYGIPGETIDGNDAGVVFTSTRRAVARARTGDGPSLIVATTYRHDGHYVGDAEVYRQAVEIYEWKAQDPLARLEDALASAGWLTRDQANTVRAEVGKEVNAAVEFAESGPDPNPDDVMAFVFTEAAG